MPEKEAVIHVVNGWAFWTDSTMWTLVAMCVLGYVAKTLASDEPIEARKLIGEGILTAIGAIGMYAGGLLQGLPPLQMIVLATLAALGGIHVIQRMVQLASQMKKP